MTDVCYVSPLNAIKEIVSEGGKHEKVTKKMIIGSSQSKTKYTVVKFTHDSVDPYDVYTTVSSLYFFI